MKHFIVIALTLPLTYSPLILANESPSPESESEVIHIQQLNPRYDVEQLKRPGVITHPVPSEHSNSPFDSDHWIKKASLTEELKGWDAVSRDVLIIKARAMDKKLFLADYPKVNPTKLTKLYQLVHSSTPAASKGKAK